MSKNILLIDSSLKIYGGQRSLMSIIRGMDQERFRPFLACPANSEIIPEICAGVEILPLQAASKSVKQDQNAIIDTFSSLSDSIRLAKFIRSNRIDLAHAQTYKAALICILPCKLTRTPLIWHDRMPKLHGIFDKILIRSVSRIVAISEAVARERLSGTKLDKLKIIYNGIETSKFDFQADRVGYRQKFDLGDDDFVIGVVGRISEEKGQEYLIEASPRIVENCARTKVLIVGDCFRPEDKRYEAHIRRLVKRLNLEDHVIFTGHIDNVLEIMSTFDIAVTSSINEPFGRVVVEAMGLRVPVVATNSGGIPEIIEDGISGILVTPKDPDGLAEAILSLIPDAEKRKLIGETGNRRFRSHFTMERTIREVQQLYHEVMIS